MTSPFKNFDAWLTTDSAFEEAQAVQEAWDQYCVDNNLDPEDNRLYADWLANDDN